MRKRTRMAVIVAGAILASISVARAGPSKGITGPMVDCVFDTALIVAPDRSMHIHDAVEAIMARCSAKVKDVANADPMAEEIPPQLKPCISPQLRHEVYDGQARDMATGLVVGYRMGRFGRNW